MTGYVPLNKMARTLLSLMRIEVLLGIGLVLWVISLEATAQGQSAEKSDAQVIMDEERTFACNYLHSVGMKEVDGKWESVDWKTGDPFFLKWDFLEKLHVPTEEYTVVLKIVADDVYYTDCRLEDVFDGHCTYGEESIQFNPVLEKGVMYSLSKLITSARAPVHITNFECTSMGYKDRTKQ